MNTEHKLLSRKQLAAELGRGRSYIDSMIKLGFEMPGGRATLEEARIFLAKVPFPRSKNPHCILRVKVEQYEASR